MDIKNILHTCLRHYQKDLLPLNGHISSAVLVPLFKKEEKYHVLFTKRSELVKDHKGQIAYPGGCYEEGDGDLLQTALRECHEEIGLNPQHVEIVGELDDIATPTQYRITPYVGIIPYPLSFKLCEREIADLIEVPLAHLLKPENLHNETTEYNGRQYDTSYFSYATYKIWGATGRITQNLLNLIRIAS